MDYYIYDRDNNAVKEQPKMTAPVAPLIRDYHGRMDIYRSDKYHFECNTEIYREHTASLKSYPLSVDKRGQWEDGKRIAESEIELAEDKDTGWAIAIHQPVKEESEDFHPAVPISSHKVVIVPAGESELYRWVKASERLPKEGEEMVIRYHTGDKMVAVNTIYNGSHSDRPTWIEKTNTYPRQFSYLSEFNQEIEWLEKLPQESKQTCTHEALIDTGIGYYHCPMCDKGWTYNEWQEKQSEDELWDELLDELGIEHYSRLPSLKQQFQIKRKP